MDNSFFSLRKSYKKLINSRNKRENTVKNNNNRKIIINFAWRKFARENDWVRIQTFHKAAILYELQGKDSIPDDNKIIKVWECTGLIDAYNTPFSPKYTLRGLILTPFVSL